MRPDVPSPRFSGAGRVEWIGIRPGRDRPVEALGEARAVSGRGLAGDHAIRRSGGRRQVTLLQLEHLPIIGVRARRAPKPALLRRNLVVSGIDLQTLVGRRFRVGAALLEGTGDCPPCRAMDAALGAGGRDAMTGMGGVTARVVADGWIRVGDSVGLYNQRAAAPNVT